MKTSNKSRGILYSPEMISAQLDGHKTMTRRTKGLDKFNENPNNWKFAGIVFNPLQFHLRNLSTGDVEFINCPFGKVGDLLYSQETHRMKTWCFEEQEVTIEYKDGKLVNHDFPDDDKFSDWLDAKVWKLEGKGYLEAVYGNEEDQDADELLFKIVKDLPYQTGRFMPKAFARIWARITDIRIERLHEIQEQDAISEGCIKYGPFGEFRGSLHPSGGLMKYRAYQHAVSAFKCIWENIHGESSWKPNPWVWVVSYEILSTNGANDKVKEALQHA